MGGLLSVYPFDFLFVHYREYQIAFQHGYTYIDIKFNKPISLFEEKIIRTCKKYLRDIIALRISHSKAINSRIFSKGILNIDANM